MKVESLPSTLHLRMRSLGWSVKKTFPSLSHAGPSVKEKSPASFWSDAPGAITGLSAARAAVTPSRRRKRRGFIEGRPIQEEKGCGVKCKPGTAQVDKPMY